MLKPLGTLLKRQKNWRMFHFKDFYIATSLFFLVSITSEKSLYSNSFGPTLRIGPTVHTDKHDCFLYHSLSCSNAIDLTH